MFIHNIVSNRLCQLDNSLCANVDFQLPTLFRFSDIDVDRMNRLQMLTKLNVDSNAFSVDKIALLKNRFQSE